MARSRPTSAFGPAAFLTIALLAVASVAAVAALAQEEPRYPGMGPGHYITAVRENGRFITLEDKSQWEIAEFDRHLTSSWQEMEGISIRYAGGEPADQFRYEIDDIERDEGASARWVRPQR